MKLKARHIDMESGGKYIVIINSGDAFGMGVAPLERIILKNKKRKITVIVNTSDKFVRKGEICLFSETQEALRSKRGMIIEAEQREDLVSKSFIRKKIEGKELNEEEAKKIIYDVMERKLNDLEIAALITALHIHGMTLEEAHYFSKAMIETSKKLSFPGTVVDKHSIGGVCGDKTSMVLVPVIASLGFIMPKTSSRSITSPAGTADRMEVLAPVEHTAEGIKRIVRKCNACLVWGGTVDLAPADDLLIRVEHPLALDPFLLPSVMSKKKVVGSKYVVIDIPKGPETKIKTKEEAERLAKDFISLGRKIGINVDCAITRGDQPIGYAIGPALEAREALETLLGRGPDDLIDKVASIGGLLLQMVKKGNSKTVMEVIESGGAEEKMRQIIKAQGGDAGIMPDDIPYARYKYEVKSEYSGVVSAISNKSLVAVSNAAGTPKDKLAGIRLHKKIGDSVKKGEALFTIYAEKRDKLKKAAARAKEIYNIIDHGRNEMLIEMVK
ncbi:MAG: AMP phosphorylase [Candidatus Aenigmarchaeota archaeon]|nr:AMP phosphorylase [Candidatus Aenigmarchaeota archaeon]MDI6722399.1 AMP phosphorylase [Candidatus Aenigmarchaeota archaeon]